MFTPKGSVSIALLALVLTSPAIASDPSPADAPRLGQPLKPLEVNSITVWPNGEGLPPGSGSVVTGRKVYATHCQACHGPSGTDGINAALVGGQVAPSSLPKVRTVGSYWPYATSLFDYVRRAMPYRTPGSLSDDEVYAVVAYLLFLNKVVAEDTTLDAAQLSKVNLPNRQRFYSEYELP